MKIRLNPDKKEAERILRAVKENDGYCPCRLIRTEDTKCICKEFKEQEEGFCHCGLYLKLIDKN